MHVQRFDEAWFLATVDACSHHGANGWTALAAVSQFSSPEWLQDVLTTCTVHRDRCVHMLMLHKNIWTCATKSTSTSTSTSTSADKHKYQYRTVYYLKDRILNRTPPALYDEACGAKGSTAMHCAVASGKEHMCQDIVLMFAHDCALLICFLMSSIS